MSESERIDELLEKYKNIRKKFLDLIDVEENDENNFQNLKLILENTKIQDYQHDLRLFLRLLLKVSKYHHRGPNFFNKIDRILQLFKDDIKKYGNKEIFNLFKGNKRILLFLINEKILIVDEYFVKSIINGKYLENKYPQYFAPEIKPFINIILNNKNNELVEEINKELPDNFNELRNKGENNSLICKLIREDAIDDFIIHITKNSISPNSTINPSIFETNSFLLTKGNRINNNFTLIEYASFYGSIQIINFLKYNSVELKPSLFIFAIQSKNAQLIKLLESNIKIQENYYKLFLKESIKCHYDSFVKYYFDNYLQNNSENYNYALISSLKYYDFSFLQNEHINKSLFCHLCFYDYYSLVNILLADKDVDINNVAILNHIFVIIFLNFR